MPQGATSGTLVLLQHPRHGRHIQIWHNPRCSKSRATLALLEEQGVEVTVRRYLDDAPSVAELDAALTALGLQPWELVRSGEAAYVEAGLGTLARDASTRDAWIAAMAAAPALIERPVVITADGRAVIGRPPTQVLDLL
jgi:arsenate reductase